MEFNLPVPQSWALPIWQQGGPLHLNLPWGRGCGKSWFERFGALWLMVAAHDGKLRTEALKPFRGVRIIGLCPTLKQFKDIHLSKLIEENESDWKPLGGKLNKSTCRIEWPGGSWFQPMPAEEATSKSARGMRADGVLGDEIDDVEPTVWRSVVKPWLSEPWSLHLSMSGGTPRRGRRGLLWDFHQLGKSKDPKFARYHSRIFDYRCCPELVSPETVEDARATTPKAIFEREWECNFDSAEGLVYPEFSPSLHVKEPPEGVVWSEILIGCDHGFDHPGALLLIGVLGSGKDAIVWVLDDEVHRQQAEPFWVDKASKWTRLFPFHFFYGGPDQPSRLEAFRTQANARIRDANNSVQDGISSVAARLHNGPQGPRLFVHPRCKHTIWEFGTYRKKPEPSRPDQYTDDPVKLDDDAMDALRYAVLTHLGSLDAPSYSTQSNLDEYL